LAVLTKISAAFERESASRWTRW